MDVVIERAKVRDADEILKLQYLCFQREAELHNDYTIAPLKQTLASLLLEYDTHCILVARCGDEVVGSARGNMNGDACYIGRVIVHPRMQRKGIATKLMNAIEAEFPNVSRYELFTGVRSEGNLAFYQKLGYKAVRTQWATPKVEIVYMEKVRAKAAGAK